MRYPVFLFFCSLLLLSCNSDETVELNLKGPVRACFFGDGGSGYKEQAMVAKLLREENCNAYFYLGDVIYPSGIESASDPDLERLFWKPYRAVLERAPMFLMMGNHDYKGNMDAWIQAAAPRKNLHYPAHYYLAKLNGNICVTALNTVDHRMEQLLWLKDLDTDGCKVNVLAGHHPAISSGKHEDAFFPLNLFLNYALGRADIYVSGHDHHLSYEGKHRGVHQFISGAAGKLRPVDESKAVWAKSRHGYLTMEEEGDRLVFRFWGLDAESGGKELLHVKKIRF